MSARQAKFDESNIALLSSKLNHDVKTDVAKNAAEWKGAGEKVGLEVWRIESFAVKKWPSEQFGSFFDGDCYIVLNTRKDPANPIKLRRDIFFWLGANASQDEMGTAAYKTVELDDLFNGEATQYRETQGNESDAFRALFPHLMYLSGGVSSGFSHVAPETYKPRLLHVLGNKNPRVFDVPIDVKELSNGDSFILDGGLKIWQWNGAKAHPDEKREANRIVAHLKQSRHSKPTTAILDGLENDEEFWKFFGGKPSAVPEGDDAKNAVFRDEKKAKVESLVLLQVSDHGASEPQMKEIARGANVKRSLLNSDDAFILDVGYQVFVYVGSKASKKEKLTSMQFADKYIIAQKKPATTPVSKVIEGGESNEFEQAFKL